MPLPRDEVSNPGSLKNKNHIKNIQGLKEVKQNTEGIYTKLA
jgi:hypothetical protein